MIRGTIFSEGMRFLGRYLSSRTLKNSSSIHGGIKTSINSVNVLISSHSSANRSCLH
jgi:hypothetical protein